MPDIPIGFNKGKVIMLLAKTTYTTLTRVIIEGVQNAIDAGAKSIWIKVDMKKRDISIANDGEGVNTELFAEALMSIGQGVKAENKLGRFGLGLISPLDKCDHFTFTSKPRGESKWWRWKFRAEDIEPQVDVVRIPRTRVGLQSMQGFRQASTVLYIHRFTKDRITSAMDPAGLAEGIQEKLGAELGKKGVTCHIHFVAHDGKTTDKIVKPLEYTGETLAVYEFEDATCGKVVFQLYKARKTSQGRNGKVSFSETEPIYPVTWREFYRSNSDLVTTDLRGAMESGFFEGIILCDKVELHPKRTKFMRDEALYGLWMACEEWFIDVGRKIYEEERQERSERRLQHLSLRTLGRINELLREKRFANLREALRNLQEGSIGSGHSKPEGKTTKAETEPGKRVGQGGVNTPKTATEEPPRETNTPKDPERPGDVPLVASGPEGKRRSVVRDNSTGLTISLAMPPGSERLWHFDLVSGVIYMNTRHPVWLMVEEKDHHILHLQEWIVVQALGMLVMPDGAQEILQDYADHQARAYVELMIKKGHLRNRQG